MPEPVFVIFELAVYTLLLLCLRHALVQERALELLAGVLYGLLLEIATIVQLQGYHYGRFIIMVGQVPLCIGVGWGVILYSAMSTSDSWNVLPLQRPFVDALLAWNIDLSMDAVAIRLGFWTWAFEGRWFGVPLANFFAWYVVVASFSGFVRTLRAWRRHPGARWIYPLVAIALSLIVLIALNNLYINYIYRPYDLQWAVLGGQLLLSLIALWTSRQTMHLPRKVDGAIVLVPLVFHLLFTGALLGAGIHRQTPALLVISSAMFLLGMALHIAAPMAARFGPRRHVQAR
jgi:uncharacterized membrane protein